MCGRLKFFFDPPLCPHGTCGQAALNTLLAAASADGSGKKRTGGVAAGGAGGKKGKKAVPESKALATTETVPFLKSLGAEEGPIAALGDAFHANFKDHLVAEAAAIQALQDQLSEGRAREWLLAHGFHPDGDLTAPIPSRRRPGTTSTALHEACDAGEVGVIEFLCAAGAAQRCLRARNSEGRTPMIAACSQGHLTVAKFLYDAGAQDDIWTPDGLGWTPLHAAYQMQCDGVVEWLLEVGAASADAAAKQGGQTMAMPLAMPLAVVPGAPLLTPLSGVAAAALGKTSGEVSGEAPGEASVPSSSEVSAKKSESV